VSGSVSGNITFAKILSNASNVKNKRKGSKSNGVLIEPVENLSGGFLKGSVECLQTNPVNNELFASAGSDKSLYLWKLDEKFTEFVNTRRKEEQRFKPFNESVIHNDTVTSISWLDLNHIITGSLDHSISIHNIDKLMQTFNINFKDSAVTKVSYGPLSSLIFCGHEDGNIRTFDERSRNKVALKLSKSH